MKRYNQWCQLTHGHEMQEHADGMWVKRVAAENTIAGIEKQMARRSDGWRSQIAEAEKIIEGLRAELALRKTATCPHGIFWAQTCLECCLVPA